MIAQTFVADNRNQRQLPGRPSDLMRYAVSLCVDGIPVDKDMVETADISVAVISWRPFSNGRLSPVIRSADVISPIEWASHGFPYPVNPSDRFCAPVSKHMCGSNFVAAHIIAAEKLVLV
jgi:hypothetical protein